MSLALPPRPGERPRTSGCLPHRQLDQNPGPEVHARAVARFVATEGTTTGPSLISVPGARALFLPEGAACNACGFLRGREFAHVHPADDGSFHMVLSADDCAEVLARGWGELHPLAVTGAITRTTVLVYAPRDDGEIDTALAIARASQRFASTPLSPIEQEQQP